MGMFDTVVIEKNDFGLPCGDYQTKDLMCDLDHYTIKNNKFVLTDLLGNEGPYWTEKYLPDKLPAILVGNYTVEIYDLNAQYLLYIENGVVVNIEDDFDITYEKEIDWDKTSWDYDV